MALISKWVADANMLNATLKESAWAGESVQFPVGESIWLYVRNDAKNMYLAIDMPTELAPNDVPRDYFWLNFDVDRDGGITENIDVFFGIWYPQYPGKMGKSFYTPSQPLKMTDGTKIIVGEVVFAFEASPRNDKPHKVWKLSIPFSEFGIDLNDPAKRIAWAGLRVCIHDIINEFPTDFYKEEGFNKLSMGAIEFVPEPDVHG